MIFLPLFRWQGDTILSHAGRFGADLYTFSSRVFVELDAFVLLLHCQGKGHGVSCTSQEDTTCSPSSGREGVGSGRMRGQGTRAGALVFSER